jgi:hypothetical protein
MATVYRRAVLLTCVECGREIDVADWPVMRVDVVGEGDETPQLAFYCRECAERELRDE